MKEALRYRDIIKQMSFEENEHESRQKAANLIEEANELGRIISPLIGLDASQVIGQSHAEIYTVNGSYNASLTSEQAQEQARVRALEERNSNYRAYCDNIEEIIDEVNKSIDGVLKTTYNRSEALYRNLVRNITGLTRLQYQAHERQLIENVKTLEGRARVARQWLEQQLNPPPHSQTQSILPQPQPMPAMTNLSTAQQSSQTAPPSAARTETVMMELPMYLQLANNAVERLHQMHRPPSAEFQST